MPALPALPFSGHQVALGEYRDVEVETSSGEDTEGEYFRVRFTEPDQESRVSCRTGLAALA